MRVLQELLAIHEEHQVMSRPMELKTFIHGSEGLEDAFPKLLKKKWNKAGEIVWHGMPLFHQEDGKDWREDGEAFEAIYQAIREYVEDGYQLEYNITIHNEDMPEEEEHDEDDEDDDEPHRQEYSGEVDLKMEFRDTGRDDIKPVWWGYDKENDKILVGYDAWPTDAESEFNDAFDEAFKEMTGEDHDLDDERHSKIFSQAHKEFIEHAQFWGLCFAVTNEGGRIHVEEEYPPATGGFFRNDFYRMLKKRMDDGSIWTPDELER